VRRGGVAIAGAVAGMVAVFILSEMPTSIVIGLMAVLGAAVATALLEALP